MIQTCTLCEEQYPSSWMPADPPLCHACRRRTQALVRSLRICHHLGGKCVRCGDTVHPDKVDFHHADAAKEFSLTSGQGKPWEDIEDEVNKCDLLCSGCHRTVHATRMSLLLNLETQKSGELDWEKILTGEIVLFEGNDAHKYRRKTPGPCISCGKDMLQHKSWICQACRQSQNYLEKKIALAVHLGGKCSSCGSFKPIFEVEFHHDGSKDKRGAVSSGLASLSFERLLEEVEGCSILCTTCHRDEHRLSSVSSEKLLLHASSYARGPILKNMLEEDLHLDWLPPHVQESISANIDNLRRQYPQGCGFLTKCDLCGEAFEQSPHMLGGKKTRCDDCRRTSVLERQYDPVTKTCVDCGNDFSLPPSIARKRVRCDDCREAKKRTYPSDEILQTMKETMTFRQMGEELNIPGDSVRQYFRRRKLVVHSISVNPPIPRKVELPQEDILKQSIEIKGWDATARELKINVKTLRRRLPDLVGVVKRGAKKKEPIVSFCLGCGAKIIDRKPRSYCGRSCSDQRDAKLPIGIDLSGLVKMKGSRTWRQLAADEGISFKSLQEKIADLRAKEGVPRDQTSEAFVKSLEEAA